MWPKIEQFCVLYKHVGMALCVLYLLTQESYWVFDLSVCVTIYGWLAGLMCVDVVAISWTKHCHIIMSSVHCWLHKAYIR